MISKTRLIRAGGRPEGIFFVLEGLLDVVSGTLDERLATLGPGDVFGEMSFLEHKPASAHVIANENSLVLSVPQTMLQARIEEHPSFAARLYRALAILVSQRFRSRLGEMESRSAAPVEELESGLVHALRGLVTGLKEALVETDKLALQNQGEVPPDRREVIRQGFSAFAVKLNELIGDASGCDESTAGRLGRWVQQEILPYMLVTRVAERMYSKPRGYAGDFLTIDYIYEDRGEGVGRLGALLDRCFLDEPAAQAVKNRRALLAEEIFRVVGARSDEAPARITSMASGPAAEIFDVFTRLEDRSQLQATCIDIDMQALAFVADRRDRARLQRQIRLEHGNLVYLATGRARLDLPPQDLVYSIGLIDYFNDRFVIDLLNYVHTLLRPGGQVILGNFHPRNTSKAVMDHILEWRLIHRTEEDMDRLFQASACGRPTDRIRFEPAGINLFACCARQ